MRRAWTASELSSCVVVQMQSANFTINEVVNNRTAGVRDWVVVDNSAVASGVVQLNCPRKLTQPRECRARGALYCGARSNCPLLRLLLRRELMS